MYTPGDYIQRGRTMLRNAILPRQPRISTLMVYATDLCDSRCQHCLIWQKRPVKYLAPEAIYRLLDNDCITPQTKVGLEGGEFLLHPQSEEIIAWFYEHHPNFDLLSNCLKPDRLIQVVEKTPPARLFISLDGGPETYRTMRGKDGYERVLQVIRTLRKVVPISVMYCVSPYNSMDDLRHVAEVCQQYEVDLRVGVYSNIKFFDTQDEAYQEDQLEEIPAILREFSENYDYLKLYEEWRAGKLVLPCKSILDSVVVLPDGEVPICMNLDTHLGNIHDHTLDEILAMRSTRQTLKHHHDNCNACWINFHRKYDLILYRNLERFFPQSAIRKLFGYYQWSDDPGRGYHDIVSPGR